MTTIRLAQRSDTQALLALWNQCLPHDPITEEKLQAFFASPHINLSGAFVAEQQNEIVGFVPTTVRTDGIDKEIGWLLSFVLRTNLYNTSIAHDLLNTAINHLTSQNKTIIKVSNFLHFRFFPHFDARHQQPIQLLEEHGFERLRELSDLKKSLTHFETPHWVQDVETHLSKENIKFVYCEHKYRTNFLTFIKNTFWENWYLKNKTYVEQNGDPKDRMLAVQNNNVVGFVNYHTQGTTGYIAQTGVSESLRGKKVGSVLVFKAIEELKKRGTTDLLIVWCPLNFYKIIDATVTRTRVHLEKEMA